MLILIITFVWFALCRHVEADYQPSRVDQLLHLTAENFSEAINSNHMVLVDFYAPWCSFCTNLVSELQMVATDLPNMNIDGRIALLDASTAENEAISNEEGVDGYPSIVLYRDGTRQGNYLGPRTRLDILEYLKKKAGPPAIPVSTREEIDDFLKQVNEPLHINMDSQGRQEEVDDSEEPSGMLSVALALFLPEVADSNKGVYGPVCKTIISLASNYEQIQFLYADNLDLISYYGVNEDSLLVFTETSATPQGVISLKQDKVIDNKMVEKFLITSILSYSLPALIPYSTQTQPFIHSLPLKKHVLIFHDFNQRSRRVLEMLVRVTAPYRDTFAFITVSSAEHQLMQFFGIEIGALPELVIADMTDPLRMKRYHFKDFLEGGARQTSTAPMNLKEEKQMGDHEQVELSGRELAENKDSSGQESAYLSKQELVTEGSVADFLISFKHGNLPKSIFSEESYSDDDESSGASGASADKAHVSSKTKKTKSKGKHKKKVYAKRLVGNEFRERVIWGASKPQNKDVFVYVYAPWCGHCKSFEPVMEDLAKLYRSDDNLVFYRIDGSKNEIDHNNVRIRGFPAMYLFPAGDKENPIEYIGERDAASIARFLKSFRKTRNSKGAKWKKKSTSSDIAEEATSDLGAVKSENDIISHEDL